MSLNNRAMKYVPTAAKQGTLVALGFAVEAGDLEVIASSHISDVICDGHRSFVGVITRTPHDVEAVGAYSGFDADEMVTVRLHEAQKAANIGSYQALYLLNYGELAEPSPELVADYRDLLVTYRSDIVFTYSPLDRNREHLVSLKALLQAVNSLEAEQRPAHIYAVNTGGDLGQLLAEELVDLDYDARLPLIESMLSVYVSLAEAGLFLEPGATALDLGPQAQEGAVDLEKLVGDLLDKARSRALETIR